MAWYDVTLSLSPSSSLSSASARVSFRLRSGWYLHCSKDHSRWQCCLLVWTPHRFHAAVPNNGSHWSHWSSYIIPLGGELMSLNGPNWSQQSAIYIVWRHSSRDTRSCAATRIVCWARFLIDGDDSFGSVEDGCENDKCRRCSCLPNVTTVNRKCASFPLIFDAVINVVPYYSLYQAPS